MAINYAVWLNKPWWSRLELCYLAIGLDPALKPGGIIFDLNSGTSEPAPLDPALFRAIASKPAQVIVDFISRSIDARAIQPIQPGEDRYSPLIALHYLRDHGLKLPSALTAAIDRSSQGPDPSADATNDTTKRDAFDPLPISGIAAMFKLTSDESENLQKWKSLARWAKKSGLHHSRVLNSRGRGESLFDPERVADWLVETGKLDRARAYRILARNLPARSQHLQELYAPQQT